MAPPKDRVVQWATGNIGSRSLRAVLEHPQLELAGVWVSSADKAGRDAGDLCGLDRTGIVATTDLEVILALKPDCVLFMQQGFDAEVIGALLEAGVNVVATCGEFHHPPSMDPALRQSVKAACAKGRASIHSTGVSPGFISEAVPLVLTSLQRRLDCLRIEEFADLSSRDSPELLFQLMGFTKRPSTFDPGRWAHGAHSFGPSLRLVGGGAGHARRLGRVHRGREGGIVHLLIGESSNGPGRRHHGPDVGGRCRHASYSSRPFRVRYRGSGPQGAGGNDRRSRTSTSDLGSDGCPSSPSAPGTGSEPCWGEEFRPLAWSWGRRGAGRLTTESSPLVLRLAGLR